MKDGAPPSPRGVLRPQYQASPYHVRRTGGIAIAICGIAWWSWVKTRCLPQMDSINASISLSRSAGLLA
jgi:hypothetical protein